ncbi:MAG TPA: glycosyltransferase family 2 protein [Verrucomicrobiae bacterium]|nr:glycosyltransferase family 2 protein [Verrucomicrobiae bacterium]
MTGVNNRGIPYTQVIMPALNEEEGIGLTIGELVYDLGHPNLLVVDGRSTDQTVEVAKNLGANVVFQDGKGKGDALAKGIACADFTAKIIVLIDADYTYPSVYIPEMIKILENNPEVGMVCGNRFSGYLEKGARYDLYYLGNRGIAFVHNFLNGVQLIDPLTGLRVVRANILRNWKPKSKGFDIEVELNHYIESQGYAITEVPIQYRERLGKKKLSLRDGRVILKRIIQEMTC